MKKNIKLFLINSIFGEMTWIAFNTFFYCIYMYINTLPKHSYLVPMGISFDKAITFYSVVYVFILLLVLFVGVLFIKKMANTFLTVLSILFFRLIEIILLSILVFFDDRLICLVNWSVASLEYLLIYVLGIKIPDITSLYYLTCFLPFVVMLCGVLIRQKRVEQSQHRGTVSEKT